MSTNSELAKIFSEMAAISELTGANPFRVNAYNTVARVLSELTVDVETLADEQKKLTEIEGIGGGSAKRIIEFIKTGRIGDYDKMLSEVPVGLLEVLKISGLGPKTVKLLWEKAGVTDIESLQQAIESGALEELPRMGKKTIENIRESLKFAARSAGRIRIGDALPVAEAIVERLSEVPGAKQVAYAGSLRRGRETIGDIDILASGSSPEKLAEAFHAVPGITKVLVGGDTKISVRLEAGMQVDLRIVDDAAFGAALMYFTGSKQHNVILRERAIKRTMRLNEYGLFADDGEDEPPQNRGVKPLAARTEQQIYKALALPFVPPEMREVRGELDGKIPKLITIDEIKAELHAHTVASDGRLTIDELAAEAKRRGFHTIAVTDHSPASAQANGLEVERLKRHIDDVRAADACTDGITILAGTEVDILADGHLDYEDEVLASLDIVVASPHVALSQDRKTSTQRLLKAIRHPLVHIIGHPTGRLVNRRAGLDPDVSALVQAAAECDTALEINANYARLDLRDTHVRAVVDAGGLIAIDTDAHDTGDFDHLCYGITTARRGWLTAGQCINTWTAARLRTWLRR